MEAWVLLMRVSHCQRARSKVFAVEALQRAAWTRWLSVCFQLCSTEHPCQTQNMSIFHATQSTGPTDASLGQHISFPVRAVIVPLLDWLSASVAHDFCNPEDPDALGDDFSFIAVTQQHWRACFRRMLRCKLACRLPFSSLHHRLAPGAFAVAKDDNRHRFDRRQAAYE